jgi:hypothetical protein
MDHPFDPDRLRLPYSSTAPTKPSVRPPRHRTDERFLKGPIPWTWLDRAARLPGKALAVGLVLWQHAGVTRMRTVRLCQARSHELGLGPASTRRGIAHLEQAGLIEVQRQPGRGLVVTLMESRREGHEEQKELDREDEAMPLFPGPSGTGRSSRSAAG